MREEEREQRGGANLREKVQRERGEVKNTKRGGKFSSKLLDIGIQKGSDFFFFFRVRYIFILYADFAYMQIQTKLDKKDDKQGKEMDGEIKQLIWCTNSTDDVTWAF